MAGMNPGPELQKARQKVTQDAREIWSIPHLDTMHRIAELSNEDLIKLDTFIEWIAG